MLVDSNINNTNNSEIQKLYKEINLLYLNMNKKEDDIINLINEKDIIIQEMNNRIIKQEKEINKNKIKIKKLNEKLIDVTKQLKKFKNKNIIKSDKYKKEIIKNLNSELSKNNSDNDYSYNSDFDYDENLNENEDLFYDEYEDLFDNEIIINKKINKKINNFKKNKKIKKKTNNNKIIKSLKRDKVREEEDYILIGITIPIYNINNIKEKMKLYDFNSDIIKSDEHIYLLKKSVNLHFPNIKIKRLNFKLADKFNEFPLNKNLMEENDDLLLNKDILLIVETLKNEIICLCFNKAYLPKNIFYLFINDNKLFYYRKKRKNEKIREYEFYRDENWHTRYEYNKETIESVGELKSFIFDDFFRLINNLESSKCKNIEVFEIMSE